MVVRDKTAKKLFILRRLINMPIIVLGIVTLIGSAVFAAYKLYHIQVLAPWNQNVLTELDVKTYMMATQISDYFVEIQSELKQTAQRPALYHALQSEDQAASVEIQNELMKKWPMLREALVLRSDRKFDQTPENFVLSHQFHQSNTGKIPAPVAVKLGEAWVIYITAPIQAADSPGIVGSLLATFSAEVLSVAIEEDQKHPGLIDVRQSAEGFPPQNIFSSGSSSTGLKKTVPIQSVQGWHLSYTAPASLAPSVPRPMTQFLSSLTAITLLALFLIILLIKNSDRLATIFGTNIAKKIKNAPPDLSPEELNKLVAEKLNSIRAPSKKLATSTERPRDSDNLEKYPAEVFREYDIRGRADGQINASFAEALGKTLGSKALSSTQAKLAIGADGRISSPELHEALIKGVLSTGCDVIDFGCLPTPVFNFGIQTLPDVTSGLIVTASHNPAEDNGFKIIIDQQAIGPQDITQLSEAMYAEQWAKGAGSYEQRDVDQLYREAINKNVSLSSSFDLIVDCANGVMGSVAPPLLETMGCEVTPLYCDIDGSFPNHPPDPSRPNNLKDLIAVVAHGNADLGLAFDGDGDRVVAISASGRTVWPDELLMIYARDLLSRQPDSHIVFDVKSTRRLESLITSYGGHPVMCKTGHSNLRRKIQETKAPLGGEYSGHIFFNDRWLGFDDGLYAAVRLLEIMDIREQSLDEIIDSFEVTIATPEIKVAVPDAQKFEIIEKLVQNAIFKGGTVNTLDGLRVEFPNGWGLIRASNTSASLTLRFEADDAQALKGIQDCFREQISPIIPDTSLAF